MPWTPQLADVGRLGIVDEGATFGTDAVASIGASLRVPVVRGNLTPQQPQEMLYPNTLGARLDERDKFVLGTKGPVSLPFTTRFASHDTPLSGNVTPPDETTWWLALLMKAAGWALSKETPAAATTTVQAGSTATVINVTATHGTRFAAGRALGVMINGVLCAAPIKSVAADAVTLKYALPSVPSNGSTVYQSVTFYPIGDETPASTHLNVFHEGAVGGDSGNPTFATSRWQYRGCVIGGFQITMPPRQLADIQWTLMGPGWSKLAASAPGVTAAVAKYGLAAVKDSVMVVTTVGSSTRSTFQYSALQIGQAWELQAIESPEGYENVQGYARVKTDDSVSQGTITDYWSIAAPALRDWFAHHQNRDDLALFPTIGSQPGKMWLIEEPNVQVQTTNTQPAGKVGGVAFPYVGRLDTDISGTGALIQAARRLHAF